MSLVHVAARDLFETFELKSAALGSNLDDPPSKLRKSNGGGSSGGSSNAAGPNVQLDSGRDKKRKSSGGGGGSGEGGQRGGKSGANKARSAPASKAASPHLASAPVADPHPAAVAPSAMEECASNNDTNFSAVARAAAQQALSWAESDDMGVVVENMFQPSDFETNETFGEELEADLLAEGEKLGPVEKITVFPKNTKGPVVIKFGTVYGASECIKAFDGRFFGGRKLSCHFWDGVTNYTVKKDEDDKEDEERLKEFGD